MDGYECHGMDTNVLNLIQVGFDCLSDLDTNVKNGYECHDRMDTNLMIGLILMFKRMDTNVMNKFIQVGFDCLSDLDTNVKDGYECHDRFDTNVEKDEYESDDGL